jgi:single-strand DNA-binding protein
MARGQRKGGAAAQESRAEAVTCNEVHLVGRLAAVPQERTLPSGEVLALWRVVVDRPAGSAPAGVRVPTVDALECVTRRAVLRRTAAGWAPGDVVEVEGALRRRFWRSPTGPASRYEVEVRRARRLSRAA